MILSQSADVVGSAFSDLWFAVAQFVPAIVAALGMFLIGWFFSVIMYRIVDQIVEVLKIDDLLKAAGVEEMAKSAGFKLDIGRFLGTLVQWFIVIVFLVASLNILGLNIVTMFLAQVVLRYIPQVIVAVLILVLAAIVADAVKRIIASSARVTGAHSGNLAGAIAKYAIWITAILAVFNQLGVATEFVQTLFTGLVVALALAFGLAFGLGGKDAAARAIEHVKNEIAHER